MSKENLEQFMKQVAESEDLQSRMGDEIAGDDLTALGAEHGWEFSIEDLQASAELSDEELDAVAGGYELKNVMARLGPRVGKMRRRPNGTFSYTEYDDTGSSKGN